MKYIAVLTAFFIGIAIAINSGNPIAISYTIAVLIGIVVSLDVCGLLITQYEDFKCENFLQVAISRSGLHAIVHSFLFFLYYHVVNLVIYLPENLINWLGNIFKFLPELDLNEVTLTMNLFAGIIIIIFVWLTYTKKIVDNYGEINHIENTRADILLIYQIAQKIVDIFEKNKKILQFGMALVVAIDMLAITSFIRVFFVSAPDAASVKGTQDTSIENLWHFNFGPVPDCYEAYFEPIIEWHIVKIFGLKVPDGAIYGPDWNVLIFGIIILLTVFVCSFCAIIFTKSLFDVNNQNKVKVIKFMRVFEPFFIFWLLVLSLDHLFDIHSSSTVTDYGTKVAYGLFVSLFLTYSLIKFNGGLGVIESQVKKGFDKKESSNAGNEVIPGSVMKAVSKFLVGLGLFTLLIILIFFVTHAADEINKGDGFKEFIHRLSIFAGLISLILLFLPFKSISEFELNISRALAVTDNKWFSYAFFYVAFVYIFMVFYVSGFSFSNDNLTIIKIQLFTNEQLFIPLFYIGYLFVSVWLLLFLRSCKTRHFPKPDPDPQLEQAHWCSLFQRPNKTRHFPEPEQDPFKRDLGALLTAFAFAIFVWQAFFSII